MFSSTRDKKWGLYKKVANGSAREELVFAAETGTMMPNAWSRDGRFAVLYSLGLNTLFDIFLISLNGDRKPVPLLQTQFSELNGKLSPDGRWLAYVSMETGRQEVYVMGFPDKEGRWAGFDQGWRLPDMAA